VKYSHRYRVDVFLAVLDSLLFEMDERFSETYTNLLKYIACLDPRGSFSKFDLTIFLNSLVFILLTSH
jgi:hypothetical protein